MVANLPILTASEKAPDVRVCFRHFQAKDLVIVGNQVRLSKGENEFFIRIILYLSTARILETNNSGFILDGLDHSQKSLITVPHTTFYGLEEGRAVEGGAKKAIGLAEIPWLARCPDIY